MTRVVRAHDGSSWTVSLAHVQSLRELHQLLSPLVSIPPSLMILMHKEGWQIDDSSLEHLLAANKSLVHVAARGDAAASRSQSRSSPNESSESETEEIYCFNRDHLDADPDELEAELTLTASSILREPPLAEYTPANAESLAQAHLNTSDDHLTSLQSLLFSLTLQRASLGVALSNLDNHLKGKLGGFETFELFASPLLGSYDGLLKAYQPSLDLLGKIQVHPNLVSPTHPAAASSSRRQSTEDPSSSKGHNRVSSTSSNAPTSSSQLRWLSDYVSRDKIAIVKDQCTSAYNDVQAKFTQLHSLLDEVHAGAAHLRSEYESDNLDDLADCSRDSEEAHQRTSSLVDALNTVQDQEHQADIFAELALLEREFRERILYLVARKNAATRTLLLFLQHIAALQSDLSQTPVLIRDVDSDLKKRCDNFKYLSRLREMAQAYAATLAEIVRRRTYSSLVVSEASDVANILSKLADSEAKRRNQYRSEVAGRLPWDIKGMEASPEHVELEVRRSQGSLQPKSQGETALPEVTREEAEDFLGMLQRLLQDVYPADLDLGEGCTHPLKDATDVLRKQLSQLDLLEAVFERLSAAMAQDDSSSSSIDQERAQPDVNQALETELQEARDARHEEVTTLKEELEQLQSQLRAAQEQAEKSAVHVQELEHKQAASEAQYTSLKTLHFRQDNQLHTVQADLTVTSSELSRARAAQASTKATQEELERQVKTMSEAKSKLQSQVYKERQAVEDLTSTKQKLEADLQRVREEAEKESRQAAERHKTSNDEKQSLEVKLVATESTVAELLSQVDQLKANNASLVDKERAFHAYKSEAEVDRASLEQQLAELRELHQTTAAESAESKFQLEQLEAKHAVMTRRQESERSQITRLPKTLDIAEAFTQHAQRATQLLISSTPNLGMNASTAETPPDMSGILPQDFFASTDRAMTETEIEGQLKKIESLASEASDAFPQAINDHLKTSRATLLRWQKECKAYRQRERSKIAFQHFKEGDLALFLPTRNTTAQIWAAFNAGFPHYFLKATGQVAEQIKTREWLVARIVSLEERTADPQRPEGNPFSLGAGVKFWLLETEPWSPVSPSKSRKSSGRVKNKSRQSYQGLSVDSTTENGPQTAELKQSAAEQTMAKSVSSLPQPSEKKATSNAASQTARALDLATSAFSLINDPQLAGSSSPVFTNPDTFPVPHSNLTRAMSERPQEPEQSTSQAVQSEPAPTLPLQPAADSYAPLSSSPQPAFLPSNHNKNSSLFPSGSISGRSRTGSYVGRRGVAVQFPSKDGGSDHAESEGFTHASLGSAGKKIASHRALRKSSSRRFSMGSSSNLSSGDKGPKGPSGRGSATLASSFVSSLGRTSGRKEGAAVGSVENINKASPSIDLLRRFSHAVESSTGSPLPNHVTSQSK